MREKGRPGLWEKTKQPTSVGRKKKKTEEGKINKKRR